VKDAPDRLFTVRVEVVERTYYLDAHAPKDGGDAVRQGDQYLKVYGQRRDGPGPLGWHHFPLTAVRAYTILER